MAFQIVLSTAGTTGDLNPFVAVALELAARGHRPIIATQEEFRPTVESEGLGFHAIRPGIADVRAELGMEAPEVIERALRSSTGLEFAVRRIAMPFLRRSFEDMVAATRNADLVVTHTSTFAARLVAEDKGLPWLSTALSPFTFMSAYDPPVFRAHPVLKLLREVTGARSDAALLKLIKLGTAPWTGRFRKLRAELGLPRGRNPLFEGQFSPYGTLALYSPVFGAPQPDFPSACAMTGFCFHDRQRGGQGDLPQDLAAFLRAGSPPLVFTLGSALVMDPRDFYDVSAQAARALGRRAVLLAGAEGERLSAGRTADPDVFVAGWAPHSKLFPHAAAVVHHGGVGTTAQALRAGAPQLVVPFSADQPDNGARVARLGVGRFVGAMAYRPPRVRRELSALLDPAYAARAAVIARHIVGENGAAAAAEVIEATLAQGRMRLTA